MLQRSSSLVLSGGVVRILFSSTWGYGHVFPMVPLARAARDAGHEVLWATNAPSCHLVEAAGLDVAAAGLDSEGVQDVEQRLRVGLKGRRPESRAAFAFPHMFGEWATPQMVTDLLPLARDWSPHLLVHDVAELASALVGAVLDIPSVTHSFGGAVPAAFLIEAGDLLSELWTGHGLEMPAYAGSFTSTYLDICPTSVQKQSLDHISARQPLRPVPYTGEPATALPAIAQDTDHAPLVYLTLGTVHNDTFQLSAAVQGLAGLGVRTLVAVGPGMDPAALGQQPAHVSVQGWVCQSEVLPYCTVVVSHAGSGTFLGALAHGLPQLCLPQSADQFRNSQAAVERGVGLMLHPDLATPDAVADAVRRLLAEDSFRHAALALAAEIRAMPAPAQVVSRLEQLV